MTERTPPPDDAALERALRALGAQLDYPATPDLARRVHARLAAAPARPSRSAWWPASRWLALALVASVLLIGVALALSPGGRQAVADRLGLRGVTIAYATPAPVLPAYPPPATVTARPSGTAGAPGTATRAPTPTRAPVDLSAGFGPPLTLDEARGRVPYPILVPTLPGLGGPDEVYVGPAPADGQVALVYRSPPDRPVGGATGLLVTQFRGATDPGLFKKIIAPDTTLEFLTVNGGRGYWIAGSPHLFLYLDRDGTVRDETLRLAGDTLLWEQDGRTLRIEGARTRDEALRIAASVR